jgi:hypothetical protein
MIGSSLGVFHKSSSKERVYTRQQRERACDNDARGAERYGRAYSGGYRRHRQRLRKKRKKATHNCYHWDHRPSASALSGK